MGSVDRGNYAIGRGFQPRGGHGSGILQSWGVRYASTEAAVTGLRFVEGETRDIVQTGVAGVVDQVVSDQVVSAGASSLGEVAAAAADCSFPTAALQHLIDFVHTQGGLPWYVQIVVIIPFLLLVSPNL